MPTSPRAARRLVDANYRAVRCCARCGKSLRRFGGLRCHELRTSVRGSGLCDEYERRRRRGRLNSEVAELEAREVAELEAREVAELEAREAESEPNEEV